MRLKSIRIRICHKIDRNRPKKNTTNNVEYVVSSEFLFVCLDAQKKGVQRTDLSIILSIKSNFYAGSYGYDNFNAPLFNSHFKKLTSGWQ